MTLDTHFREHYPKLLTPTQGAEILNVSPNTIRRMCKAGDLPATAIKADTWRTIWRIDRDAMLKQYDLT